MAKNRDLQQFKTDFVKLKDLTGVKFVIKLNRNLKMVNDELAILEKLHEESPEVQKFRETGQNLYTEYSEKNLDGSPKVEAVKSFNGSINRYVIDKKRELELANKVKALEKTYKEAIDTQNQKERDYLEALEEDHKLPFVMVEEKEIPKQITMEQLGVLTNMDMIKF